MTTASEQYWFPCVQLYVWAVFTFGSLLSLFLSLSSSLFLTVSVSLWHTQNCFELYNPNHKGQVIKACKTEADGRVVEGNHVVYRISAPTPEEKEEWIKSIK